MIIDLDLVSCMDLEATTITDLEATTITDLEATSIIDLVRTGFTVLEAFITIFLSGKPVLSDSTSKKPEVDVLAIWYRFLTNETLLLMSMIRILK